jgi:hypothetical protein
MKFYCVNSTIIEPPAISDMDSATLKNFSIMEDAYRKVWLTTAYSNMRMLKEILTVNGSNITELLDKTTSDKPGKKLRQMGIQDIPDDLKILEDTYKSKGGLCTAFTLKVIAESGRQFEEFTIGNNKSHRVAWDSDYILICSAKNLIIAMEPSNFGEKGFIDPTLIVVRKL